MKPTNAPITAPQNKRAMPSKRSLRGSELIVATASNEAKLSDGHRERGSLEGKGG
jgi:hypothetical protein